MSTHAAHAPTSPTAMRNGLGIAGLILGIIGILFGFVPLTFFIAGPLAITGLILALVGRARVKRREASNGKTALFGVLTSLIALVLSIWGAVTVFTAVDDAADELDRISDDMDQYTECVDAIDIDDPEFNAKLEACDE